MGQQKENIFAQKTSDPQARPDIKVIKMYKDSNCISKAAVIAVFLFLRDTYISNPQSDTTPRPGKNKAVSGDLLGRYYYA